MPQVPGRSDRRSKRDVRVHGRGGTGVGGETRGVEKSVRVPGAKDGGGRGFPRRRQTDLHDRGGGKDAGRRNRKGRSSGVEKAGHVAQVAGRIHKTQRVRRDGSGLWDGARPGKKRHKKTNVCSVPRRGQGVPVCTTLGGGARTAEDSGHGKDRKNLDGSGERKTIGPDDTHAGSDGLGTNGGHRRRGGPPDGTDRIATQMARAHRRANVLAGRVWGERGPGEESGAER